MKIINKVLYYEPQIPNPKLLVKAQHIIRQTSNGSVSHYQNSLSGKQLDKTFIRDGLAQGTVLQLEEALDFKEGNFLWITSDGGLVYAALDKPMLDATKIKVGNLPSEYLSEKS